MSKVTVVAKIVAKQEAVEAVKAELFTLIAPTRKEEGCIEYNLHQDNQDPAVFIFCEIWESAAHLEKHAASAHYGAYVKAVEGLIEKKIVHKLTRIEPDR
ncbi:putative quinol monooxygenase [Geobacter sp. SVR]|uniref:putative quinol monooxygenase n=1 Tax=Geobacter sp. SVR TaxID=2495594 RepID=UPI00143F0100|nr:putative quinol monooxygenase [Geobacter sp. SVR]BCS52523.1 antibiotic biosynthesis monooxygenase [Geobacter sp. SVR]GCF84040.1 antibiotic biosynthesis monooxygenase [Geobacter sp. SVR]